MTTARARVPGAGRALEPDADSPADDPVADDGWRARTRRLLFGRALAACAFARQALLAASAVALDACIASLQRLRSRALVAEPAKEQRDRNRTGKRAAMRQADGEPAAEEAAAPKPRRRLRSLLVYLSVMLAGGMGGTVLAYDLLSHLLEQRSVEIKRQEAALLKHSKSAAQLKKALVQQQAKQIEAETRLTAALAENETRLTAALADNAKQLGEIQVRRSQAETQPVQATGGGAARHPQAAATGGGNCTLTGGNIRSALSGCIAEMNRR